MPRDGQLNHFASGPEPDLFGAEAAPAYRPDLGKVRSRLRKILGEAKGARTVPWDAGRLSLYRTIFPQMTLWLPEDEAARLRLEFETEIDRLTAG